MSTDFRHFTRDLLKSNSRHARVLQVSRLKESNDFSAVRSLLRTLSGQLVAPLVGGMVRPRTYTDLATAPHVTFYTEDDFKEVAWIISQSIGFSSAINLHLKRAQAVSTSMLWGRYEEAEKQLEEYKNSCGCTFWLIENALLLAEQRDGLAGSVPLAREIWDQLSTNQGTRILLYFINQKTQRRNSIYSIRPRIESSWEDLGPSLGKELSELVSTVVISHEPACSEQIASLCYNLGRFPIVDRYIYLKRIARGIKARNTSLFAQIKPHLEELYRATGDQHLAAIIDDGVKDRPSVWLNMYDDYVRLQDKYVLGEYAAICSEAAGNRMNEVPQYETMILRARAAALLPPNGVTATKSPLDDLFDNMVARERPGIGRQCNPKAVEWAMLISGDSLLSLQLEKYIRPENSSRIDYSPASSPFEGSQLAIRRDPSSLAEFAWASQYCSKSIAMRYMSGVGGPDDELQALPRHRALRWRSLIAWRAGDWQRALTEIEHATRNALDGNANVTEIESLFDEAIEISERCENLDRAVELALLVKDVCPDLPRRFSFSNLVRQISSDRSKYGGKLQYAILLALGNRPNRELHNAYSECLRSLGETKPRALFEKTAYPPGLIHQFLRYVCTKDVMAESVEFATTDDIETERLVICDYLRQHDREDSASFEPEIKELTDSLAMRKGMKHVAESKIFVDEPGLRKHRSTDYGEYYNRFRDSSAFDKEVGVEMAASELLPDVKDDAIKGARVIVIGKPGYRAFCDVFRKIRDDFVLSNEFGLDSYLSVRIRHGVLLGQLRGPFERHQLITKKSSVSGRYFVNEHWEAFFGLPEIESRKLQEVLGALSGAVDRLTDDMNGVWLRVATEHSPRAGSCFDFNFKEFELITLYEEYVGVDLTVEGFVDRIFKNLWTRTERCLETVRERLTGEALPAFLGALDEAERGVVGLSSATAVRMDELLTQLLACKTDVQNEMEYVASWFRLNRAEQIGSFTLEEPLGIALKLLTDLHPKARPQVRQNIGATDRLVSRHFTTLVDLFLLVIGNAFDHSVCDDNTIDLEITGNHNDGSLVIEVSSLVTRDEKIDLDVSAANESLRKVLEGRDLDTVRREGKSGVYKILNLLRHKLGVTEGGLSFERRGSRFVVVLAIAIRHINNNEAPNN